jgi:HrpA-like RNA helicase
MNDCSREDDRAKHGGRNERDNSGSRHDDDNRDHDGDLHDRDDNRDDDGHSRRDDHRDQAAQSELPIEQYRDAIVEAIDKNPFLLIVGETGSGKTTQIPQWIHRHLPHLGKVAISQPRRVAAVSVATRVAEELQTRLGSDLVGYRIRFGKFHQLTSFIFGRRMRVGKDEIDVLDGRIVVKGSSARSQFVAV